jgi:hypothetical protein
VPKTAEKTMYRPRRSVWSSRLRKRSLAVQRKPGWGAYLLVWWDGLGEGTGLTYLARR